VETEDQEVRRSGFLPITCDHTAAAAANSSRLVSQVARFGGGLHSRPVARPDRIDTRTDSRPPCRLVYRSDSGRARRDAAPAESIPRRTSLDLFVLVPRDLLISCSSLSPRINAGSRRDDFAPIGQRARMMSR